jgi:deazaflavin-dependent oxidoreductase (nitroreductase family)
MKLTAPGIRATRPKEDAVSNSGIPYIRPGRFMTFVVNPIARHLGTTTLLTVRGRVSGEPHTTPLGRPFEYQGVRYLVSGRGQTQWARNLRAAHSGALRVRGHTERFRAVEVTGPEHDAIVTAYRDRLGRSVRGYFERIPDLAHHPVFRIEEGVETRGGNDR